jgi:hypothetical protein
MFIFHYSFLSLLLFKFFCQADRGGGDSLVVVVARVFCFSLSAVLTTRLFGQPQRFKTYFKFRLENIRLSIQFCKARAKPNDLYA